MDCVLLDTKEQFISRTRIGDETLVEVEHDGWFVKIPVKTINQFKASNTLSKFLSPFSFLYFKYKRQKEPGRLYVAILDDYIYAVTFEGDHPLYFKIYPLEGKTLLEYITDFLHDFYGQENSFFVEKVEIYRFNSSYVVIEPDLEDGLLLDVKVHDEDLDKVCSNSEITRYFIKLKQERNAKGFVVKRRFVWAVGLSILVLLALYDLFLRYQNGALEDELHGMVQSQVKLGNYNNEAKSRLMHLQKIRPVLEKLREQNALLYTKIKSVFDLVPDHTYLTLAEFDKGTVLLEGVTSDREELRRRLDGELRKSFQKGRITFQKDARGYRFRAIYEEMVSDENRTE